MKTLFGLALVCVLVLAAHASADDALSVMNLPAPVSDVDYYENSAALPSKIELGRVLFFDKVLSGNKNISCATCHHPDFGTSDGVALGFGEGPTGLGPDRVPGDSELDGVYGRVPRNSPALFNLGAQEFSMLFHDGRVEVDSNGFYDSGFITPAKWKFPDGLENTLAAQAMFPVTSPDEMAGQKGENSIADAVSLNNVSGPGGVWEQLADRLRAIPEYVVMFRAAFPDDVRDSSDLTYVKAANAIAAFEAEAFRADNSPFDRYLRGETASLTREQRAGMEVFYGKAKCGNCHVGKFQTDHDFHAIAMPQIGPGKGDGSNAGYWSASGERAFLEDFGRGRVTVRPGDRFKFRTPSLRNVEITGPWGHDGAYKSLEEVVRHHLDPRRSLERYVVSSNHLPDLDGVLELSASGSRLSRSWLSRRRLDGFRMRDAWVQRHDGLRSKIANANELSRIDLSDREVANVIEFLHGLTDEASRDLSSVAPTEVPSGLPVVN